MKTERSDAGANRIRPRLVAAWVLILALFVGQLLIYTWCRVQCIRAGYEISAENNRYQRQLTVQNTLRIELERLRTPERIAAIARRDIGLAIPASHQKRLVVLNESY